MRIRLQVLLPLLVGIAVGTGFLAAATMVGDAVASALGTVPGITRERAVESAVRSVALAGTVATILAVTVSYVVARMVVRPLTGIVRTADRLAEGSDIGGPGTPVAEIRDAAHGISRATGELRDRHGTAIRERSELAALVEAVSEGIMQIDAEGRIVRANRAARRLLGLPEKVSGYLIASLIRNQKLRQIVERGVAGERRDADEVLVDDRRILVSVAPQPEGGAVATFVDLTDLRRLEEVRRDFVANASHELKTPLTAISGYTNTLLSNELSDPERRQFLEIVARNAERLQRIVDDLLDLSRLEAGAWQPDLEPVRVMSVARSSWLPFADRVEASTVDFAIDDGEHAMVLADRRALEQVFANLYDNALRYTPAGGVIRVSARAGAEPPTRSRRGETAGTDRGQPGSRGRAEGHGWTLVEVEDTGAGIPSDALPRIFERFYRTDPARSRAEGGTGLGLSIVKHMVEGIGGEVTAHSALGKGTTIRLWLRSAPTS